MQENPNFIACLVAAIGAALLSFAFSLTSIAGVAFAFVKLAGLPDIVMWVLIAIGFIPVVWATIWTAGRAWHVENRLERGQDVDQPVFKIRAYFQKKPASGS